MFLFAYIKINFYLCSAFENNNAIINNILKSKVMQETTVKIELGKTDLQIASTEVIKHLTLNPPTDEECTTAYYMGVEMLFDVLESTFKNDERRKQ